MDVENTENTETVENTENLEDETLKCRDCGDEFVFTVGEQEFYNKMKFENKPVRCKPCRDKRKNYNRR